MSYVHSHHTIRIYIDKDKKTTTKNFICENIGVPQTKVCTKSLLWSQRDRMCVWPAQSDCKFNYFYSYNHNLTNIFSGPVKNSSPEPSGGGSDAGPWMPRGTMYPISYTRTDAPPPIRSPNGYKSSVECPPTQSWRVPDPYDCSIYHDCYHGTDLVSYCSALLQYNPDKQICDYPQNVQCK